MEAVQHIVSGKELEQAVDVLDHLRTLHRLGVRIEHVFLRLGVPEQVAPLILGQPRA